MYKRGFIIFGVVSLTMGNSGFPAGDDGIYYGELYRDGVLYHERVFYDGKGDEDALDSGRSRHFHSGRHRSQHSDCRFSDIKAYEGAVKILLALTVAGQVRLLYNQWGNFVFRR